MEENQQRTKMHLVEKVPVEILYEIVDKSRDIGPQQQQSNN